MNPGTSSDPFAYGTWMMEMLAHFGHHPGPIVLTEYMYAHLPPKIPGIVTLLPNAHVAPLPYVLMSLVR